MPARIELDAHELRATSNFGSATEEGNQLRQHQLEPRNTVGRILRTARSAAIAVGDADRMHAQLGMGHTTPSN